MAIPTISSITPATGVTTGEIFVELVGTNMRLAPAPPTSGRGGPLPRTVDITFDGIVGTDVTVRPDPSNPPDGTIVTCRTPAHAPGTTTLVLKNVNDEGEPIPGEVATVVDGFTFVRPDLRSESDLERVVRTLVRAFRDQVLDNTTITVHTDFDDDPADLLHTTRIAKLPALVLFGPDLAENRFYALNGTTSVGGGDAPGLPFAQKRAPFTVDLRFLLVGIDELQRRLQGLMRQCVLFMHKTKFLPVPRDALDPSLGTVRYELDFQPDGLFEMQTRISNSNIRHFEGSIVVRGVDIDEDDGITVRVGRTSGAPELTLEPGV